jgi:hypothetical protein
MKPLHSISHVQQLILGVSSQSTHIYCTGRASALSIITSLAFFQPDIQTTIYCMEKRSGVMVTALYKRDRNVDWS